MDTLHLFIPNSHPHPRSEGLALLHPSAPIRPTCLITPKTCRCLKVSKGCKSGVDQGGLLEKRPLPSLPAVSI